MTRNPCPPEDDILPLFTRGLLIIIIALFAIRNAPWHLDDDEQAKQAYVSYQMIEDSRWMVQETPTGRTATKPPLQGWIAAGAYLGLGAGSWEIPWRLPAFAAALALLGAIWRAGDNLFGNNIGAVLAAGMFGLNSYVPRLATLVRTDMMLSAFIFFTGLIILNKLRTGAPWTTRDRIITTLLLLGSTMTKGPIAYAFLLPGIIAYTILARKWDLDRRAWAGTIWWLIPLAVFGAWVAYGCTTVPAFYDQVVVKEFLGRFTVGEGARHHNFYPGFYTVFLIIRTLPWTLLLVAFFTRKEVRQALKIDPALLWLVCWTLGGLLFMEFVPSKRFDRILPVVPPMCLLLAASARYLPRFRLGSEPIGRIAILAPLLAIVLASGYAGWKVVRGFRHNARALVAFGEQTREAVGLRSDRLAVVNGKDEGMLMYTGVHYFTSLEYALKMWRFRRIDWLVLGAGDYEKHQAELEGAKLLTSVPKLTDKFSGYYLLRRIDAPASSGAEEQTPKPEDGTNNASTPAPPPQTPENVQISPPRAQQP